MYGGLFKKRRPDAEEENASVAPLRTVHHYPSHLPFPVVMDASFPAEMYVSRSGDAKVAVHWGQRKLLLSEMQLLTLYARPQISYHIVYAGSAPGTHLAFLDELFQRRHTWELIDPGKFDRPVLEPRPNFLLRNEFFTNATAYGINVRRLLEVLPALGALYRGMTVDAVGEAKKEVHEKLQDMVGTLDVARGTEDIPSMYEPRLNLPSGLELLCHVGMERSKPLLFVSDIRSGSVHLPNFEEHVAENMRAQECWCQILQGEQSMLKFRLPYTHKRAGFGTRQRMTQSSLIGRDGMVSYVRGDILLPIWTRPTSTEGRLVVPCGALPIPYHVAQIENQFFFFNSRVREQVHFNHLLLPEENLDHHFDAAAEVHCILSYLQFIYPHLKEASTTVLRREIQHVSSLITTHLGITFRDAIRRREALVLKQATAGQPEGDDNESDGEREEKCHQQQQRDQKVPKYSENDSISKNNGGSWGKVAREMIATASRERARVLWKTNVDESVASAPSGSWVTVTMKQ